MFHYTFGPNIVHVPLLVWPPQNSYEALARNAAKPVSQADVFATALDVMHMEPVAPVDGVSLCCEIPANRLRTVSTHMATMPSHYSAIVVYPDLSFASVDYVRWSVTLSDHRTVVPFEQAPPEAAARFRGDGFCLERELL